MFTVRRRRSNFSSRLRVFFFFFLFHVVFILFFSLFPPADAMEASQMYCDMPPQSAFNFAGYNHSLPPTPPHTEEEPPASAMTATAATTPPPPPRDDCCGGSAAKRPVAAATTATAGGPEGRAAHREPKRPKRETAPSPDIDIVNVAVVRSSSPDVLKPRQEKIWRPYGATDE